jgi:anti-sigma regulatory factor (Ser/Thr protein kinase)
MTPVPERSRLASITLAPIEGSARAARLFLLGQLTGFGVADPDEVDLVLLLTSELVTNAICHGDGQIAVRTTIRGRWVRVEVDDATPCDLAPGPLGHDGERGRGLAIVDALAADWGVIERPGGKTVWFDCALSAPAVEQHSLR